MTRLLALALLLAAVAVLLHSGGRDGPAGVQTAGYAASSLIAAALLSASAVLAGPTVLFTLRRRKYRRILAAEG
jgi:hypothetical protein